MADRILDVVFRYYADGDLLTCGQGIARQADLAAGACAYGESYWAEYQRRKGTPVAKALNAARVSFAGDCQRILDVGIGSGEFLETWWASGRLGVGYDINPMGVAWLLQQGRYADPWAGGVPSYLDAVTLWDCLEHMPAPSDFLFLLRDYQRAFVTIPVVADIRNVRESKHYKPGEHLWYFTDAGFRAFALAAGFAVLQSSDMEQKAGRQDVLSYELARR